MKFSGTFHWSSAHPTESHREHIHGYGVYCWLIDDRPVYVGLTLTTFKDRLKQHVKNADKSRKWIQFQRLPGQKTVYLGALVKGAWETDDPTDTHAVAAKTAAYVCRGFESALVSTFKPCFNVVEPRGKIDGTHTLVLSHTGQMPPLPVVARGYAEFRFKDGKWNSGK